MLEKIAGNNFVHKLKAICPMIFLPTDDERSKRPGHGFVLEDLFANKKSYALYAIMVRMDFADYLKVLH